MNVLFLLLKMQDFLGRAWESGTPAKWESANKCNFDSVNYPVFKTIMSWNIHTIDYQKYEQKL